MSEKYEMLSPPFFGDNTAKGAMLFVTDILFSVFSLLFAAMLKFGKEESALHSASIIMAACIVLLIFPPTFLFCGFYKRHWRFASIPDLLTIIMGVLIASILLVGAKPFIPHVSNISLSIIIIQAFILMSLLCAVRLSYRVEEFYVFGAKSNARDCQKHEVAPALLVGAGNAADHYLRALERDRGIVCQPVGILDDAPENQGLTIRGVPVLGTLAELEHVVEALARKLKRPQHLIFTEGMAGICPPVREQLIDRAERLGLATSRLSLPTELRTFDRRDAFELRPIDLTDLLERPQRALDFAPLMRLVGDRRLVVTGAGGSIGSELARQIAALEPAEVILLESSEYNLYSIDSEIKDHFPNVTRFGYICDVRDAARVNAIFDRHSPEWVFHAAALKHVPILEENASQGFLTNVIGTVNIADAARRVGALGMTQTSTDKAVNTTNVLGITKRLAELYCQALDLEAAGHGNAIRFVNVRFGNVLGSSGSLIPLFKLQLARGGPLTITDPRMMRFFMTIYEAVELTLAASGHGMENRTQRGTIFVLDMGEPVKIIDIARRIIRLAGYVPDQDIRVETVGCRPGEKLHEELFNASEICQETGVPGVLSAVSSGIPAADLRRAFHDLRRLAESQNEERLIAALRETHSRFQSLLLNGRPSKQGRAAIAAANAPSLEPPRWTDPDPVTFIKDHVGSSKTDKTNDVVRNKNPAHHHSS